MYPDKLKSMHRNIDFYMQTHGWVLADRLEHSHTRPRSSEKEKREEEAESQTIEKGTHVIFSMPSKTSTGSAVMPLLSRYRLPG